MIRSLLLFLFLVVSNNAEATSRLKMTSDRAILVQVNLVPYTLGSGGTVTVDFKDGREGNQNIRLLNMIGQQIFKGQVFVERGTVVTARWEGRQLLIKDRRELVVSSTRAAHIPKANSSAGARKLHELADDGGLQPDPFLDVVADVQADETTAAPAPSPTPAPNTTEESPEPSSTESDAAPSPAGTGPAQLKLQSRTGTWANVYLDDTLIEFRGSNQAIEQPVELGSHRLVIRDFRDSTTWGSGTLEIGAGTQVLIEFGPHAPPTAFDDKSAWTPDEVSAP